MIVHWKERRRNESELSVNPQLSKHYLEESVKRLDENQVFLLFSFFPGKLRKTKLSIKVHSFPSSVSLLAGWVGTELASLILILSLPI